MIEKTNNPVPNKVLDYTSCIKYGLMIKSGVFFVLIIIVFIIGFGDVIKVDPKFSAAVATYLALCFGTTILALMASRTLKIIVSINFLSYYYRTLKFKIIF